jgi:hypothetical protein
VGNRPERLGAAPPSSAWGVPEARDLDLEQLERLAQLLQAPSQGLHGRAIPTLVHA